MDDSRVEKLFTDLKKICELGGISGYEDEVRSYVVDYLKPYADEIRIDSMGNVIAVKKGGNRRFMMATHMDEIGLMVRYVNEKGFIYFSPIGGWNERILPGMRVRIKTSNGEWVRGVIGVKPPHLMKEDEKKQVIEMKQLFVDVGAKSREEVYATGIENGSPIIPDITVEKLYGTRVTGKSFDDRAGLLVGLRTFIESEPVDVDFVLVATVQEEVGLKGARTSAFSINPHIALAVDVTTANDVPGVEEQDAVAKLGEGPAIKIVDGRSGTGLITNPKILSRLKDVAKKNNIPYQAEVLPGGTTDATIIQLNREGVPSGVISVPTRYIHSPVELLDLKDLYYSIELAKAFYESLDVEWIDEVRGQVIK